MKTKIFKTIAILAILALLIYSGFYYGAKVGGEKAVAAMRAQVATPYVYTGTPTLQNMEQATRFIALVKPLNAVDVKTQVSGTIENVAFTDGQYVKEGDVLFTIEQDRYQANVSSAKASVTKAEADLKQVQNDYARQKELYRDKIISTADLEKAESKTAQAKAAVEQAKAALELAEIDLKHTVIKAPIDGRIGQVLITKGNYVDLSTPALARIVQTTPVKISFSLTDKDYLAMRKMLPQAYGTTKPVLKLELSDKSVVPLPVDKEHIYFDNEMDKKTATIALYAEFDNQDELLLPNNHITVLWTTAESKPSVTIPQTAVYNDTEGSYVMLVNADNKVVQRYVQLGQTIDDKVAIEEGLTLQDTIVLTGGQKLHNGQGINAIPTGAN